MNLLFDKKPFIFYKNTWKKKLNNWITFLGIMSKNAKKIFISTIYKKSIILIFNSFINIDTNSSYW